MIALCPGCGRPPRGTVQAGQGFCHYWLECRACGRRTSDRQGFEQAVREWNARCLPEGKPRR